MIVVVVPIEEEEEAAGEQNDINNDNDNDSNNDSRQMDKADRRYKRHERENRFLKKSSEDYQVIEEVFDKPTMMVIQKMINHGTIKSLQSHFAAGKESKVFIAEGPDGSPPLAVKIYLTVSAEFKKRMQYIAGDPRFTEIKKDTRSFIAAWARKEFKNLKAAHSAGVRVPAPVAVEKNVLVMEFIGDDQGRLAEQLENLQVTADDYRETVDQLTMLYQKANLVHADLSEYNVFKNPKGEIMLLDFGSAVDIRHPHSKQFLVRDVENINRFFTKRGIDVIDTDLLIEKITGSK
ncbi:MAG: serine protein kinase RIO [Nitrososphaera sp.]